MLGQVAAIATSLTAAVYAFRKLEGPLSGKPLWLQVLIVAGPITFALIFNTIPTLIRERQNALLKRMAIDGKDISPGYFSLAPRVDEKSFVRADEIHYQVVRWIEGRRGRILYLSGLSGSGKTSLLQAWVRPQLERIAYKMLIIRGYESPVEALRKALLNPGSIWQKPPDEATSARELLERAARYLSGGNLLVVFDQFEEALILEESSQVEKVRQLIAELNSQPIANVTVLLVFRSDYSGLVSQLQLPPLQQDDNWTDLPPFTERDARRFLLGSGIKVGDELLNGVLREAAELDQTKGLVRPVTINVCGLVLTRFATGLDKGFRPGSLVRGFLKESLTLARVREIAGRILPEMITPSLTKRPRKIRELAETTHLDPATIHGCLLELGSQARGIVRPLDAPHETWEISHDFLVPLIDSILARNRRAAGRVALSYLPWLATAVLVLVAFRNGRPDNPHFGTLGPEHDLNADRSVYAQLDQSGMPRQFGPIPVSRGGPEPVLTLEQIYGSDGSTTTQSILKAGKIVFQAAGSTGFVSGEPGIVSGTTLVAHDMENGFRTPDVASRPSFLFLLGDIVFNFGERQYYYSEFYQPYIEYPAPILAIAGNHDGMVVPGTNTPSLAGFLENFCASGFHQSVSSGGTGRTAQIQPGVYFTFEAPFLRIIALYSNNSEGPGVMSSEGGHFTGLSDVQSRFVESAFNRIKTENYRGALLILVHHTLLSPGPHGGSPLMLQELDQISASTGVWPHAILTGHAINYQRYTRAINSYEIPVINSGNGGHGHNVIFRGEGAPPLPLLRGDHTLESYDDANYGYLVITADPERLRIDYHAVPPPRAHAPSDSQDSATDDSAAGPSTQNSVSDSVTIDLKTRRLIAR
jgi:hypothetical protein